MSFASIALWIAGGTVITAILAAGIDLARREQTSHHDGAVRFEARSTMPLWATLLAGAVLGLYVAVAPLWCLLFLLPVVGYWPRGNRLLLRVRDDVTEHLPIVSGGPATRIEELWAREPFFRISATDIRALEWDGFDNVGIRLHDGSVACVNCRFFLREEDREPAKRAILALLERALGKSFASEPPLDVAPWVVAKPPRASA